MRQGTVQFSNTYIMGTTGGLHERVAVRLLTVTRSIGSGGGGTICNRRDEVTATTAVVIATRADGR